MKISKKQEQLLRSNFSKMRGKGYSLEDIAAQCGMDREAFTRKIVQLGLYEQPKKASDYTEDQVSRMKELYRSDYDKLNFTGMAKQLTREFGRKVSDSAVRSRMIKAGLHNVKPSDTGVPVKKINIANFCQDWLCAKWR